MINTCGLISPVSGLHATLPSICELSTGDELYTIWLFSIVPTFLISSEHSPFVVVPTVVASVDLVVGDVCSVVVTSVTVGLVMLTDTVVDPWVDVVTTGTVVVSTDETVVPVTVVVTGEVPVVVDSTEVGGCVTTDV